jgi:hypothetical protein
MPLLATSPAHHTERQYSSAKYPGFLDNNLNIWQLQQNIVPKPQTTRVSHRQIQTHKIMHGREKVCELDFNDRVNQVLRILANFTWQTLYPLTELKFSATVNM